MTYQSKKVFSIFVAVVLSMACVGVHGSEASASSASCHDGVVRGGEKEKLSERLFQALEYDNIADALACIKKGANVKAKNSFGETALHVATLKGLVSFFDLLIQRGADVDAQDSRGQTPLHLAVMVGNVPAIIKLRQYNARVDIKNNDGKKAKKLASKHHPYDTSITNAFQVPLNLSPFALAAKASGELESQTYTAPCNSGEENSLIGAVKNGDLRAVAWLLAYEEARLALNIPDEKGNMPLHLAVQGGNVGIVKLLLLKGAYVYEKNGEGKSPFEIALDLALLSSQHACLVAILNDYLSQSLFNALNSSRARLAEKLIEGGANVNVQNNEGDTPLHIAVMEGLLDIVKKLIAEGANVNAQNSAGDTPLHIAVKLKNFTITRVLLLAGAETDKKNHKGDTPYSLASDNKMTCFLREMRKHLPSDNPLEEKKGVKRASQPAASASEDALLPMASAEMHGFDADASINDRLIEVVKNGSCKKLQGLLRGGLRDINCRDSNGNTLLHLAVLRGHEGIIKDLLSRNADISVKNNDEKRAIDLAEEESIIAGLLKNQESKLKDCMSSALKRRSFSDAIMRIEQGADVNAQSSCGETALHLAVWSGSVPIIKKLIAYGADVNIKNKDGKTPMDLARELHPGNKSITDALVPPLDSSSLPFASAAEVSGELDGEPVQQKQQKRARVDD